MVPNRKKRTWRAGQATAALGLTSTSPHRDAQPAMYQQNLAAFDHFVRGTAIRREMLRRPSRPCRRAPGRATIHHEIKTARRGRTSTRRRNGHDRHRCNQKPAAARPARARRQRPGRRQVLLTVADAKLDIGFLTGQGQGDGEMLECLAKTAAAEQVVPTSSETAQQPALIGVFGRAKTLPAVAVGRGPDQEPAEGAGRACTSQGAAQGLLDGRQVGAAAAPRRATGLLPGPSGRRPVRTPLLFIGHHQELGKQR